MLFFFFMKKNLISRCSFCSGDLVISGLSCHHCDTKIETSIQIPPMFRLSEDLQQFVMIFLQSRGSIREVEKRLGISYPTVCKRLDLVNELLGNRSDLLSREEILGKLESGEITAKQAAALLKRGRSE